MDKEDILGGLCLLGTFAVIYAIIWLYYIIN